MNKVEILRELLSKADQAAEAGEITQAIHHLQRGAASASEPSAQDPEIEILHGDICVRLAEMLNQLDRLPESMQAYQEAADSYGRVPGAEARASHCARQVVKGAKEMWRRPDRLDLLIARIDRERRQLQERPGTESDQADLSFKAATIFQRRDRFEDASKRYSVALSLFGQAPDSKLKRALCHQRLAGLYQYELASLDEAVEHYREAIALYAESEAAVDGEQMNRTLCEELLRHLLAERMLQR